MSPRERGLGEGFNVTEARRRDRERAATRSAISGPREVETAPESTSSTATAPTAPLPPPRRRRQVRVQLNTRIAQDLHERVQAFVQQHDAAVQDVVETALTEYLDRRELADS